MMRYLTYLILAFSTYGCFVLYDAESTQQEKQQKIYTQKKTRAQDSVANYIKRFKLESEIYNSYDFSELYEVKPKEILEYEDLVNQKKRLPLLENTYHGQIEKKQKELDSLIALKKDYIKKNRIYSTIEIGHIYSLKNADTTIVAEQIYNLYPNYVVKNYTTKYYLRLTRNELNAYEKFIFRKPLFISFNQLEDERKDDEFYSMISKELDVREDKNTFLKHSVQLINLIHQKGAIKTDFIAENFALNYLKLYTKNDSLTILKKEMISSTTEGKSSDNKFDYQFTYYTSQGDFTISFNKFFEIVEILAR
jgi:hypothetical protein